MGLLIEGKWVDKWYDTDKTDGRFERDKSRFRHIIGEESFKAENNRYHLYVSMAWPWAHRILIFRHLKGLEALIPVTVVKPEMLSHGWEFDPVEPLYSYQFMHQLYTHAQADYSGRVTVPVLWDKQQETIVNNESAEIIRMMNHAFNDMTGNQLDFYPQKLQTEIDKINDYIYHRVNNGVYRCGFTTKQDAYEEAYHQLFEALDVLEHKLDGQAYLLGEVLTEADWRLFTTLIRFDAVYYGHFKANQQRIIDYPNLYRWLKHLYNMPGIAETVDMSQIKRHYYYSHTTINPTQIVPLGPKMIFT